MPSPLLRKWVSLGKANQSKVATMPKTNFPRKDGGVVVNYTSDDVLIPDDFLVKPPHDAQPIQMDVIDFKSTNLPEYDGKIAVILENVLSASECAQLLELAEASAKTGGWRPAMLCAGAYREALDTEIRNSDRIVWDTTEIADRILNRCLEAEGLHEIIGKVDGNTNILGDLTVRRGVYAQMTRLNERMRFLRYSPGQYFRIHADGSYSNPDDSQRERSLFTLHLYLNGDKELIKGGATTFYSKSCIMDPEAGPSLSVHARTGRVLIFQHAGLFHAGDEVEKGLKYTMRTDIMYQFSQPLTKR